jgi:glycine/D-amino acid oxidase-like deaminating enzyme
MMSSSESTTTITTNTVIIGSGIIGLCTAYFLSESGNAEPESIYLVDASSELFRCASGFAGGFLAADCEYHLPLISISISAQPRQTSAMPV